MGARRIRVVRGFLPIAAASALLASAVFVPTSGAGAAGAAGSPRGVVVGHGSDKATITRDSYGVPTITSSTIDGMWFGAGYAQAQDRMVQLELVRRTVEGTLSGLGGSSELSQDEDIRNFFYTPAELEKQYLSLPAGTR
ncbi:MAG: penicillin acylase family protein, partial [Acidimicrobiales bacterium]